MAGTLRPPHQVRGERLELGPRELHVHVLGSTGVHGEEGKVDVRLCVEREGEWKEGGVREGGREGGREGTTDKGEGREVSKVSE